MEVQAWNFKVMEKESLREMWGIREIQSCKWGK